MIFRIWGIRIVLRDSSCGDNPILSYVEQYRFHTLGIYSSNVHHYDVVRFIFIRFCINQEDMYAGRTLREQKSLNDVFPE